MKELLRRRGGRRERRRKNNEAVRLLERQANFGGLEEGAEGEGMVGGEGGGRKVLY